MTWTDYWAFFRRRWWILVIVLAVDVIVSGYLYARDTRHLGYMACTTLYVADVGAPSLISAPPTTLAAEGQLLAGETAANFFGDDIDDVAESQHVAAFVSRRLASSGLPDTSESAINGSISASRRDRTLSICANNPDAASASAVATAVGAAMTSDRKQFFGKQMARRTFVGVVSSASALPVSASHARTNFLLRLVLGLILAGALALLAEALDPRVVSVRQVEELVGVPIVAV